MPVSTEHILRAKTSCVKTEESMMAPCDVGHAGGTGLPKPVHSVSPWRCITGCGIGPLNHRFTPKVVEKGVSAA